MCFVNLVYTKKMTWLDCVSKAAPNEIICPGNYLTTLYYTPPNTLMATPLCTPPHTYTLFLSVSDVCYHVCVPLLTVVWVSNPQPDLHTVTAVNLLPQLQSKQDDSGLSHSLTPYLPISVFYPGLPFSCIHDLTLVVQTAETQHLLLIINDKMCHWWIMPLTCKHKKYLKYIQREHPKYSRYIESKRTI